MRVIHRGNRLGRDGRYHLDRQLSEDPLGSLWLAKDVSLGTSVTIRVLRDELVADTRFQRCLRTTLRPAARFEHPNVPGVIAARGTSDGHIQFVVMRAFEGEPLAHRLPRAGPLDRTAAERVASQVKAALDAAHAAGLVHGGLGPHSVILTARGARVIDFGIAAALRQAASDAVGPPRNGSAEEVADRGAREPDEADDDRALELLQQQMLTGRPPAEDELSNLVGLAAPAPAAPKPTNGSTTSGHSVPTPTPRPRATVRKPLPSPRRSRAGVRVPRVKLPLAQAFRAVALPARGVASATRSVGRIPRRAITTATRGTAALVRSAGRLSRGVAASIAHRAAPALRFVGRAPGRGGTSVARGTTTAVRFAGRIAARARASSARGTGSAFRSVGRASRRAGSSGARGAGAAVRAAGRMAARVGMWGTRGSGAAGRAVVRSWTAVTASMTRSARAGGRVLSAIGPRRLAVGSAIAVIVTAGSIAFVGLLGSPETQPRATATVAESPPVVVVPTPSPQPEPSSGVAVPDVVGLTAMEAIRLLQSTGLAISASEPTPGPPGEVVGTDPVVTELVEPGTLVTLFVGTTPDRLDPDA